MKWMSVAGGEKLLGERQSICAVSFAVNSSKLSSAARQVILQNNDRIKSNALNKIIRLEGFSSMEGDREINFRLSIARARAVERFLRGDHSVLLGNYITDYGSIAASHLTTASKRSVQIAVQTLEAGW